jgi:hypothetical protein
MCCSISKKWLWFSFGVIIFGLIAVAIASTIIVQNESGTCRVGPLRRSCPTFTARLTDVRCSTQYNIIPILSFDVTGSSDQCNVFDQTNKFITHAECMNYTANNYLINTTYPDMLFNTERKQCFFPNAVIDGLNLAFIVLLIFIVFYPFIISGMGDNHEIPCYACKNACKRTVPNNQTTDQTMYQQV